MARAASNSTGERAPSVVVLDARGAARVVAAEIAALASERAREGRGVVLGLAAGRTPEGVYRELVRLKDAGAFDPSNVSTFNVDEFVGLNGAHPLSFRRWTEEILLAPLEIERARACVPDGEAVDVAAHCRDLERQIARAGGIDLQILGLGRNGHIGFNEPGSARDSRTRAVELDPGTREDAAERFGGLALAPTHAITLGVATILEARRIRLLAFGEGKRAIVKRMLEEEVSPSAPATFLRSHPDCRVFLDRAAAAGLARDPSRAQ